jgi:iron complex outermembrane receptor protein
MRLKSQGLSGKVAFQGLVCAFFAILSILNPCDLHAAMKSETSEVDYTLLSLEELLNVEVVSASKKSQKLSDTSAAVYVINQEDIKRSGARTIPDVLRMVPGLQVARIDANKWAITSRGFNGRFSNKLLVLVDGRSVYTHLFSGVIWDMQDTMLEDIERIEVIRGPGATIWGANAVNGVINIITKKAASTQGGLLSVGIGTEERVLGAVRHGGQLNADTYYRLFAKYFERDGGVEVSGAEGNDAWDAFRTGFRMDWKETVSIHGEVYKGDSGGRISRPILAEPYTMTFEETIKTSGGHLSGRFEKGLSDKSAISVQAYYDWSGYDLLYLDTAVDTFDLEFNHRVQIGSRHDIVWGGGARFIEDHLEAHTPVFQMVDEKYSAGLFSGFVQDEITFYDNRLRVMIGSKFEHNEQTGFEIQPNLRVSWSGEDAYSLWAAASRAVRTPSRIESDILLVTSTIPEGAFLPYYPGAGFVKIFGDSSLDSEELLALEMGLRVRPTENISVDLAVFHNIYDNLRGGIVGEPFLDMSDGYPVMILPALIRNVLAGESHGLELVVDWFLSENWKIKGGYTYLEVGLDAENSQAHMEQMEAEEDSSPRHQVSLQSLLNLPGGLTFDVWGRYMDGLGLEEVHSCLTADIRLGWQVNNNLELSITGQNILESSHIEFLPQFLDTVPTKVEKSVYGKATWTF